jgi:hypothetical protein
MLEVNTGMQRCWVVLAGALELKNFLLGFFNSNRSSSQSELRTKIVGSRGQPQELHHEFSTIFPSSQLFINFINFTLSSEWAWLA